MADEQELTWRLSDRGMDLLERAGLAGLYMALRAARECGADLTPLTWRDEDLKPDAVTLRWNGPAKPPFVKLVEWAWQVRDGVLYFPTVHDAKDVALIQNRVAMHNGVMRTLLQAWKIQPKGEPVTRIIQLDEGREVSISYQPPIIAPSRKKKPGSSENKAKAPKEAGTKKLLKPWNDLAVLFGRRGVFKGEGVELSNWVYPGIAGRYGPEKKGKPWKGPPALAILLMLAPTICLYLRLPKTEVRIKSKKVRIDNWVAVIPDIHDLEEFGDIRPRVTVSPDATDVASLGDAGMLFLARYTTDKLRRSLHAGCRVVAMGKVSYYPNQSIRKAVLDVEAEERTVKRYRLLQRELANSYFPWNTEHDSTPRSTGAGPKAAGRILVPTARGRIADNIVEGREWYTDLALSTDWDHANLERRRKRNKELNDRDGRNRPTSHETILFDILRRQRSQLMNLIAEDAMWDDPHNRVFLEAFWETLSRCYYMEKKAAEERGGARTAHERINHLNEKIHRELLQASTQLLLRKTLTEFFSVPAGLPRSPSLSRNVAVVWRLIDTDWRKGRDLALLALMTYLGKKKTPAQPDTIPSSTKEPNA
jgi:CRISPR-associated protein Cas8a1/Csx13